MEYVKSDILANRLKNKTTVIMHGCNCFCTMGAGIAKRLKTAYPAIHAEDKKTRHGDENKLGTILPVRVEDKLIIVNCYTQYMYGRTHAHTNHNAVWWCLNHMKNYLISLDEPYELRSPKIGCGLAGGDWNIIENIFKELLPQAIIYHL